MKQIAQMFYVAQLLKMNAAFVAAVVFLRVSVIVSVLLTIVRVYVVLVLQAVIMPAVQI
jgi:hypothetical protein